MYIRGAKSVQIELTDHCAVDTNLEDSANAKVWDPEQGTALPSLTPCFKTTNYHRDLKWV